MSEKFRDITAYLKWLNFWIRHASDQADAKMRQVNHLIRQLSATGFMHDTVLLGPIIHHRYYAPQAGGSDSSQLAQAALGVPGGLGVILWDSEEYTELLEIAEGLESAAVGRLQAFEACEAALQALLLPHIEPLLEQLYRRLV